MDQLNAKFDSNIKREIDKRGRINVNESFQTGLPGLFLGGNIIQGPNVIHGFANGHKAARGNDEFLFVDSEGLNPRNWKREFAKMRYSTLKKPHSKPVPLVPRNSSV